MVLHRETSYSAWLTNPGAVKLRVYLEETRDV